MSYYKKKYLIRISLNQLFSMPHPRHLVEPVTHQNRLLAIVMLDNISQTFMHHDPFTDRLLEINKTQHNRNLRMIFGFLQKLTSSPGNRSGRSSDFRPICCYKHFFCCRNYALGAPPVSSFGTSPVSTYGGQSLSSFGTQPVSSSSFTLSSSVESLWTVWYCIKTLLSSWRDFRRKSILCRDWLNSLSNKFI
jgi:hypothetical protein